MDNHRYELIINNGNIVNSLDNDDEYIIYIFQNPVSNNDDQLINQIKTMNGIYVILNISSKICNIREVDYNEYDIFNEKNINTFKKYIENPKCIKIILAFGEYLRRKFKNKFNYFYYDILKIMEPYEDKLYCYNLTNNYKLPYLGHGSNILKEKLIPYKISNYLFYTIDTLLKNRTVYRF